MKEKGVVSWKLPPSEMSCQHFPEIPPPSENNHIYSIITSGQIITACPILIFSLLDKVRL